MTDIHKIESKIYAAALVQAAISSQCDGPSVSVHDITVGCRQLCCRLLSLCTHQSHQELSDIPSLLLMIRFRPRLRHRDSHGTQGIYYYYLLRIMKQLLDLARFSANI